MKVVLDTNVFISAILTRVGNASTILQKCREGIVTLALSKPIVDELGRVLHKPYLRDRHHWTDAQISQYVSSLVEMSDMVAVSHSVAILEADPTDSFIVDCAVKSHADFVVSGDPHLLSLKTYQGIDIITPAQCVEELLEHILEGRT